MSVRDSQRGKLYKAEKILEVLSRRLETIPEIETFLMQVLTKAPIKRRYGDHLQGVIKIRDGRGATIARGCAAYIKLPKWARCEYIVLHEIAHTIVDRRHGDTVAGHGREFAATYLDLVRFGMGVEAYDVLKASFKAHRVKFRPKRGTAPAVVRRPRPKAPLVVRSAIPLAVKKPPTAWDRQNAKARRDLQAIAKRHGFTFKVDREFGTRLAWLETDSFPGSDKPYTTMHYEWVTTLERVKRCIADPSLLDSAGGYSE